MIKTEREQLEAALRAMAAAPVDRTIPVAKVPDAFAEYIKQRAYMEAMAKQINVPPNPQMQSTSSTHSDPFWKKRARSGVHITDTAFFNPISEFEKEFGSMKPPTLYPTIRRRGLIVELTLPANTTPALVIFLNTQIGLRKIDDYRCEFHSTHYDAVHELLTKHFGKVNIEAELDPNAPIELFVEYIGKCRSRSGEGQPHSVNCYECGGSGLSATNKVNQNYLSNTCHRCNGQGRIVTTEGVAYASGWVDGSWGVRFPEAVLRAYFPPPEEKFDGDFYKALLKSSHIDRTYKQLARRFHPDLNRAKGAVTQFHKLKEAYDVLRDPMKRKRYQAGLAFQKQEVKEIVFEVPYSCGDVKVRGVWSETTNWDGTYGNVSRNVSWEEMKGTRRLLNVTEILSWTPRVNSQGLVMVATWDHNFPDPFRKGYSDTENTQKPFIVSWENQLQVEFEVNV